MTVLNMVKCYSCREYYSLTSVNLTTTLKNRLTRYACHVCYTKTGLRSLWDGISQRNKDTNYFEVHQIQQHKITRKGRLFLTSWAGFPNEFNTWLPEKHLDGAIDLLDGYLLEKGLPPTKIRKRLGSSQDIQTGDQQNWSTTSEVVSQINKIRKGRRHLNQHIPILMHVPQFDQFPTHKFVCIIDIGFHAHVLLVDPSHQKAWTADGTNVCHQDDIKSFIKRLLPANFSLEVLSYTDQLGVDDCTSSAVLITTELLKEKYLRGPPSVLRPNTKIRALVRASLHHGKLHPLTPGRKLNEFKSVLGCAGCGKKFTGQKMNRRAHAHSLTCLQV